MDFLRAWRWTGLVALLLGAYLGTWCWFTAGPAWSELPAQGGGNRLVVHVAPRTANGVALYRAFLPLVLVEGFYRGRVYVYDLQGQFSGASR